MGSSCYCGEPGVFFIFLLMFFLVFLKFKKEFNFKLEWIVLRKDVVSRDFSHDLLCQKA